MEQVIYTASPLRAFSEDIVTAAAAFVFTAILVALSRNKASSILRRVCFGACAIGLLGVCIITVAIALSDVKGGPHQIIVTAGSKKAERHTTKTSESYAYLVRADAGAPTTFYVSKTAYDQIALGGCYQFTYYGELINPTRLITEIRQLEPQRCAASADR
jgi:hypothetical protein